MANASVKANRFNIKKIVYALISKDDTTAYNYGTIKTLGAIMSAQFTPSYAEAPLYGGGIITDRVSKLTGGTLKVEVNKIPIENRAEIYGHTYASGVLTITKDDQAEDIAIGYEIEQTSSKRELVWLFKCKAKPFGNNNQQSTNSINYSTDTIDFDVMAREYDGKIKADGDTANADFTDALATVFLDTIPGGTLVTEG